MQSTFIQEPQCGCLKPLNTSKDIQGATNPTSNGATETPTNLVAESTTDQTVTFHDDRVTDHSMFPSHVPLAPDLLRSVKETRTHDIKDFLGRPSVLSTGIISTANAIGDTIFQVDLPADLLALAMYREKTRGFLSFRATVNLRFQANAQRFQQGRLFINYFPQAILNPKKDSIVFPSLTLSTQLPRVDFDFSTDSDVALSIPYVSPTLGFNQTDGTGAMGTYRVRVYSPLVSPGGPATVDWTVWCWFTDVELDFPTLTPQSSRPRRQARKLEPSEMETAPISTLFKKVSSAATLFKDVPLLSSVAGTVSWAANIGAKVAAAFGFSNPDTPNTTSFVHANLANDIANVNAVGNAVSLGLLSDNKVAVLPGFSGTDIDEMSFNYLASIPSYIDRFSWTTSQTATSMIYSKSLSPGTMATFSPSAPDFAYPTPMLYIANMFKYWRSGFVFTFKFVKTEFHSGRLAVVFIPGLSTLPTSFLDSKYGYREVLDLRESNEFTITIPYAATLPYMSRNNGATAPNYDNMGWLYIYVLNPLVAPTTVSPSIDVIVEVAADDTFEVAVPDNMYFPPVMYQPGTGAPTITTHYDDEFEPQALGENVQDNSKEATTMPDAPSIAGIANNDGGLAAAVNCIGEKIVSFRSLAKRAAPIFSSGAPTNIIDVLRPKIVSLTNYSDNTAVPAPYALDYISMIAPLYNYQRGGLKFHAYTTSGTSGRTFLRAGLAPNSLGTAPAVILLTADEDKMVNNSLAIHTGPEIAGGLSFTVPQYSRTHCEMYRLWTASNSLPTDIYCSDLRIYVKGNAQSGTTRILRQAADDWTCGFFTGCMPIRYVNQGVILQAATM